MDKTHETRKARVTTIPEQGHIFFFFSPKVNEEDPESLKDVQRFHMVLRPLDRKVYRMITVGRKKLPDVESKKSHGTPFWGFVDKTVKEPEDIRSELQGKRYQTKTRGEQKQPAMRPAGEGLYALTRHEDHMHLVYALELPRKPRDVQEELNIEPEASYVINVKNPEAPAKKIAGLSSEREAHFPKRLQEKFQNRKFIAPDPVEFLDHEGAELLFISASGDVSEELGIDLDSEKETRDSASILQDLKLNKEKYPLEPLFKGTWDGG